MLDPAAQFREEVTLVKAVIDFKQKNARRESP